MNMPPPDEPILKIIVTTFSILIFIGLLTLLGFIGLGVWKLIDLIGAMP